MSNFHTNTLEVNGPVVQGDHITFVTTPQPDPGKLADQLERLRLAIELDGLAPHGSNDVEILKQAEVAAKGGDTAEAVKILSKAGSWVLDVATKIGVPVVAAFLKSELGIPK